MLTSDGSSLSYLWTNEITISEFKQSFSKMNIGDINKKTNICKIQNRETTFVMSIAAAFVLFPLCKATGWLLPKRVGLVNTIGEYLLAMNSVVNPIQYFWKCRLSRNRVLRSLHLRG